MAKDILLYGTISQYNAMFFFDQINEATKEDSEAQMIMRVNCEGGEPQYGMSAIEKVQEMADQFSCKVGAMCHSMALFILAYLDTAKVECIDTTQAVLHRAAWPSWMETSVSFPGSLYEQILNKTNKDLEKAFRAKVNIEVLEGLPQMKDKNITLKDIFSMESRIEVLLTAQDLKKIGLVSKINKITPTKQTEMTAQLETFKKCASLTDYKIAAQSVVDAPKPVDQPKTKNMTLDELKANHPALYAQIIKEGHEAGVKAEKDRVESILVFNDVDPEGCKTAIEAGTPLTSKQMAEFARKSMSAETLDKVKKDSAKDVETKEVETPKTEKEKTLATFEGKLEKQLNLKSKVA